MKLPPITHCDADLEEIRHPGRLAWWIVAGLYYGYPKCCVRYFIDNAGPTDWCSKAQRAAGNSTGFVPCPCCADRVNSGDVELKDLIVDRKATKRFPRDGGNVKEIEEFADELLHSCQEAAE